MEALSAVLTLTYVPATNIGKTAEHCFPHMRRPYYDPAPGGGGSPAGNSNTTAAEPSGNEDEGEEQTRRRKKSREEWTSASPPAKAAAAEAGARTAGSGAPAEEGGGVEKHSSRVSSFETEIKEDGAPQPKEEKEQEEEKGKVAEPEGMAGGGAGRRLGSNVSIWRSAVARSFSPLRKWRVRSSEFMQRLAAATVEHALRLSGEKERKAMYIKQLMGEDTILVTAAQSTGQTHANMTASYALIRRAIENLSLLSRSGVSTRQALRVELWNPVTNTYEEQSLMLLRHSAAAGFPGDLLEQEAEKHQELQPTLLFRSILPFVVGLAHGLNKVHVTVNISVPLVAENQQLLEALVADCRLQRVYLSLEVTLQAVRAMFFKQTHGKRPMQPFFVRCRTEDVDDQELWPPQPPDSFIDDVAELAAEYTSLAIGFGSTP